MLERLFWDKHSSLFRTFVNYGRHKFYNIGHWRQLPYTGVNFVSSLSLSLSLSLSPYLFIINFLLNGFLSRKGLFLTTFSHTPSFTSILIIFHSLLSYIALSHFARGLSLSLSLSLGHT
jgi:hypothetical protein